FQDESLRRQTNLTCIMEAPFETRGHRTWNICIFADDEGVGSAELHDRFLDDSTRLRGNGRAGSDAARYGRALDAPIIDDFYDVLSVQNQVLEDAFRKTGFTHDPLELKRTPLSIP